MRRPVPMTLDGNGRHSRARLVEGQRLVTGLEDRSLRYRDGMHGRQTLIQSSRRCSLGARTVASEPEESDEQTLPGECAFWGDCAGSHSMALPSERSWPRHSPTASRDRALRVEGSSASWMEDQGEMDKQQHPRDPCRGCRSDRPRVGAMARVVHPPIGCLARPTEQGGGARSRAPSP